MRQINLLLVFVAVYSLSYGQQRIANFGLTSPQDPASLPRSAAKVVQPVRKAKANAVTVLQPVQGNDFLLTGGWELAEASKVTAASQSLFSSNLNTDNWYNATVPGTVLTSLVNQGVYPDPYFGLNNLAIPDSLCRIDWWYRIAFKLPKENSNKNTWLVFNGINYRAEVWLNGKQLGTINGAFRHGEFNASDCIKRDGENVLVVHILPPNNPGIPHEESPRAGTGMNGGQLCLDGPTFISSEGWDWVPGIRDRNIGIWQDVHIRFTDEVKIIDPQVITDLPLPDTTNVSITVRTGIENISGKLQQVTVTGKIENINFSKQVNLKPGEKTDVVFSPEEFPQLKLKNPRLWWPNGYGRQELYNLDLMVNSANRESDHKTVRFGIREMSYDLSIDAKDKKDWRVEFNPISALKGGKPIFDNIHRRDVGAGTHIPKLREDADPGLLTDSPDLATAPYMVIKVNGKPIFCRGGNWGMDDAMKNVTREHLEPYFRLHHDANLNMVRNWTGENTEENFYDLCDEYGMLVWNDFWLTTQGYNLGINDDNLFLDNARDVIIRFRNHPSIAVWNPRNEGYAPDYIEEHLAGFVAKDDGTRLYQPNSINMNLKPSGPWNYFKNPADYFRNNAKGFNTEQGTPSLPTSESMRKMMAKEDVWPVSDVWYYHDFHDGLKDYNKAINSKYGKSESLEEYCKKAQMVNFDSHRAMFESWNSKLWNNTTGLLLWMTHPAWPSMEWQIYSWDYETFGSYFGSLKACEPIHAQYNLHDSKVVIINTCLKEVPNAKIEFKLFNLQGKVLFQKAQKVNVRANQLTDCFIPELPSDLPEIYLARVVLTDSKGNPISINEYWKSASDNFQALNQLEKVELKGKIVKQLKGKTAKIEFELVNHSKTPAVGIKLNLRNPATNERILPAYFSDGYFTLFPGESRRLTVDCGQSGPMFITTDGYNVTNQSIIPIN
jgi:hypothetical protein